MYKNKIKIEQEFNKEFSNKAIAEILEYGKIHHYIVFKLLPKTTKIILAFIHKIREEDRKVFVEITRQWEPLQKDHSKCPKALIQTCIGYQNAQSDFDNQKEELLDKLNNI